MLLLLFLAIPLYDNFHCIAEMNGKQSQQNGAKFGILADSLIEKVVRRKISLHVFNAIASTASATIFLRWESPKTL